VEQERTAAARLGERMTAVRAALPHQAETWFADEGRQQRIVAMADEAFTAWVDDLRGVAPQTESPRQTAMLGENAAGLKGEGAGVAPAAERFLGLRALPETKKEA
jgi:hypothetical protein